MFQDIPPSPPLPLKRPDIEKYYDDTFLPLQSPTVEVLKTDSDLPITNLIDKAKNILEMVTKKEKQDLDKYDIHLSKQLSKILPEEQDDGGGGYLGQEDNQKINESRIPQLTEILSKIDKCEVPKQLEFFEREVKTKNLKIK